MRRHKIGHAKSKRLFRKTADRTHQKNMAPRRLPMRGGIRL